MIYFYKYEVEWFDDDSNFTGAKESGITIGENYTEASSNVAQLYGDDQLGYIHLVCISSDPGFVLTEEDLINIAKLVEVDVPDIDLGDYYTKEEIDALLANLPAGDIPSGEEVKF